MSKNSLLAALVIIVILAVLSSIAFLFLNGGTTFFQDSTQPAEQPSQPVESNESPPLVQVIVALQPIARGSQFVAGSIGRRGWPEGSVLPPDIIADEIETINKIARTEIVQGQLIVRSMLADPGAEGEASLLLSPGDVGVAYPIDRQSSVAYAIQPGDSVDILTTVSFLDVDEEFQSPLPNKGRFIVPKQEFTEEAGTLLSDVSLLDPIDRGRVDIFGEGDQAVTSVVYGRTTQIPRRVAQLTVESAKIVGIGSWLKEPPPAEPAEGEAGATPTPNVPDIVTLGVNPQNALVLLWLRENAIKTEMALRAANEGDASHITEAVTLQYMLTRFDIAVPPKIDVIVAPDLEGLPRLELDLDLWGIQGEELKTLQQVLEAIGDPRGTGEE